MGQMSLCLAYPGEVFFKQKTPGYYFFISKPEILSSWSATR